MNFFFFFSLGTAAILADKTDSSPKLWTHQTSKEGLQAATLANKNPTEVNIWKPTLTAASTTAALSARDKAVFPKEDRNSIAHKGRGNGNANRAATAAHSVPATETAARAIPEAYAWGERSKKVSNAGLAASTYTHAKSTRLGSLRSSSISSSSTGYGNGTLGDSTVPDGSYMLNNMGNLEEAARRKANERLSKIYLPTSNTNLFAPKHTDSSAGGVAAAAAHMSSVEDTARLNRERQEKLSAVNQYESVMNLARERAQISLDKIEQEAFYKNPLLNTQYYQEALAIAQEKGTARLEHHGKINIGGGVYMTQSDVDAIAERNVRPVLIEISEKAAAQRQADEDRRIAEEEERKRVAEEKRLQQEQKAHDRRQATEQKQAAKAIRKEDLAKQKAEQNAIRMADRQRRDEERKKAEEQKQEERFRKAEQKAKQKEAEQVIREQRRKDKHDLKLAAQATAVALAQARQSEALAAAEVQKSKALAAKADAEVQAAKLAESQAASDAEAEKARAEATQAEAELRAAEAQVKDAEAKKAEAEAQKAQADRDVHEAVIAQRENERKYKEDLANVGHIDGSPAEGSIEPSTKSIQDIEDVDDINDDDDDEVSPEVREILASTGADVDAETERGLETDSESLYLPKSERRESTYHPKAGLGFKTGEKFFNNKDASEASFATAEGDSLYSTSNKPEVDSEDRDKGKVALPAQSNVKSMLDVESINQDADKPDLVRAYPDFPSPSSSLPESSAMAAAKSVSPAPPTPKPTTVQSPVIPTSPKSPAQPVKSMLDVEPVVKTSPPSSPKTQQKYKSLFDDEPVESEIHEDPATDAISSPDHKPVEVSNLAPPASSLSSEDPEEESEDEIVVSDPVGVVPDDSKTPDGATLNTSASIKSASIATPASEAVKSEDKPTTVLKKKKSSGFLSKIKDAVIGGSSSTNGSASTPKPSTTATTTSTSTAAAAAAAAATAAASQKSTETAPSSSVVPKPVKKSKPIERTFSGFSQGGDEIEGEETENSKAELDEAFKDHDSVTPAATHGLDASVPVAPAVSTSEEDVEKKVHETAEEKGEEPLNHVQVDLAGNLISEDNINVSATPISESFVDAVTVEDSKASEEIKNTDESEKVAAGEYEPTFKEEF